jgi:glycosyltransferase involved in cell wall biosynthesis
VKPSISVLIPTAGRATLERALHSVVPQLGSEDEVIVVGDIHDGRLPGTEGVVRRFGPQVRYLPHDAGHHCFGHCQLNAAIETARGDYIHCNDDDDIYTPDAFSTFRRATRRLDEPRPLLFRFRSYYGPVFWDTEGVIRENHIGGHCLLMPNLPGRTGRFTCRYQGDYDWIRSTLDLWPNKEGDALWEPSIIALARPS